MSKIIQTIARMRSREELAAILDAATARDTALMNQESARTSKRVMSKYEGIKPGTSLYVHVLPHTVSNEHKAMFGKPLTVIAVRPKKRHIEVRYPTGIVIGSLNRGPKRTQRATLRWSVLDRLKVSTVPTPEALAYVLKGGEQ